MLMDLVPEKRQDKTRDKVSDIFNERIDSGDLNALTQFARFHLDVLVEPDYETAYSWYSVAAALKCLAALEDVKMSLKRLTLKNW